MGNLTDRKRMRSESVQIDKSLSRELRDGEIYSYYASGPGSYNGTTKRHLFADCRILKSWLPAGWHDRAYQHHEHPKVIIEDPVAKEDMVGGNVCAVCRRRNET